jgi:hypothetical protein
MLKQDWSFSWNDDTKKDFIEIKRAISSAPILQNQVLKKISLFILMLPTKQYLLSFLKKMIKAVTNQ